MLGTRQIFRFATSNNATNVEPQNAQNFVSRQSPFVQGRVSSLHDLVFRPLYLFNCLFFTYCQELVCFVLHKYSTKNLLKFSLKCAKNKNIRLMKNLKQNYEIWRKCFRPNLTSVLFVFLRRAVVAVHLLVKILSSFYKQCYQYKNTNILVKITSEIFYYSTCFC